MKVRSPRSEVRKKREAQAARQPLSGFWILDFGFPSTFDLRTSDFTP